MKKLLSMIVACMSIVFSLQAQPPGGNMDEMRAKMKERIKPMLVSKAAITDAEADKVIDIYFQTQMETRKLRMDQSASEEDKAKKAKSLKDDAEKQMKAIPLTDEKMTAVNDFLEEMKKRQEEMRKNRGGNN
jgi:hypothetical protein